jgi:hypothetical protein
MTRYARSTQLDPDFHRDDELTKPRRFRGAGQFVT